MSVKKQLEFTRRAIHNIADAEAYIAQDNPAAAQKIVASIIYKTAERLESFPETERPGRVAGAREIPLDKYPYTIIYRIRPSKIVVYAVLHQSRQYP